MVSELEEITGVVVKSVSVLSVPEPLITDVDVQDIKDLLRVGDCIVCRRDYEFSNTLEKIFTGAFWGHAAIYLGGEIPVYESVTRDGFRKVSIERLCLTKDSIGICRLPGVNFTTEMIKEMTMFAENMLHEKYDYALDWDTQGAVYCSEAVVKIWQSADPLGISAIKGSHFLGEKQVTPQNIWNSCTQVSRFGATK